MITPQAFLSMTRHIVRRSDGYRDRRILHPRRDWLIGLVGAACLFVVGSAGAGYLFWSKSITIATADAGMVDVATYDTKRVSRVLAEYRSRKARYEALREDDMMTPVATSTATSTNGATNIVASTTESAPATVAE